MFPGSKILGNSDCRTSSTKREDTPPRAERVAPGHAAPIPVVVLVGLRLLGLLAGNRASLRASRTSLMETVVLVQGLASCWLVELCGVSGGVATGWAWMSRYLAN